MRIAGKLTVKDWKELSENLDEDNNRNWGVAVHFFEERVRTRYLKPIRAILRIEENNGEGFAVVNLQCSLIETIECFINGWIYNTQDFKWYNKTINNGLAKIDGANLKRNDKIFTSFLEKREPFKNFEIDGEVFFKNVRCALLHETQTKNNWLIKKDSSKTKCYEERGEMKIIYRDQFQDDLEELIKNYKKALVKGEEFDGISSVNLRANYKSKLKHICKQ